MAKNAHNSDNRIEDAARAGWLYYVAQNTQDEIAKKMGVSRQSAQRLVSLAMTAGLVKIRLDHPVAKCMDLANAVQAKYGLESCEVTLTDPASDDRSACACCLKLHRFLPILNVAKIWILTELCGPP